MTELNGPARSRPMPQFPEPPIQAGAGEEAGCDSYDAPPGQNPTDSVGTCVVCQSGPALPQAPVNRAFGGALGQALGAAVGRALEHERRSRHKLEIRFSVSHDCCRDGLIIVAGLANPDRAALDKSKDQIVRRIAWSDLEPRACELPSLVDEAVAELEASLDLVQRDQNRLG
jgi:hypothetical protein